MTFSWLYISTMSLLWSTVLALDLPDYPALRTNQSRAGVLEIAFNNSQSEVNVWGQDALTGLTDIVKRLQNDTETKVVLFKSDIPQYFMAHLDLLIQPFGKSAAKLPFLR